MTALQEIKKEEAKNKELYNFLKDGGYIIYEAITGSQAHGTSTPQSDIDKSFVYILPEDDILGTKYREQIRVNADYTGFEIKRFLELAQKNNPTILEILASPSDCIEICHPEFQKIRDNIDVFISKVCKNSFGGYARQQIRKARGLDKKQNWEKSKIIRKTPFDFCYWIAGNKSYPLREFLELNNLEHKFCGLVKIPNARDMWALYYDQDAEKCFSEHIDKDIKDKYKEELSNKGKPFGKGYKGIQVDEGNQLRSSSVSKEDADSELCVFSYNENGYTSHCKDYKEYQIWIENRNTDRYVTNKAHGQEYDSKNLMHCVRLLKIAREIVEGKGINIRRKDAEELLKIRRGDVPLSDLIKWSENEMREIYVLFDNSDLPDIVDREIVHKLLVDIRRNFYGKK